MYWSLSQPYVDFQLKKVHVYFLNITIIGYSV